MITVTRVLEEKLRIQMFLNDCEKHKQIVETTETISLYDLSRPTMLLGNAPQIIYHHCFHHAK